MSDTTLGLPDKPIRLIILKNKNLSTQYLVDLVKECYGEINSLPDGTFEALFKDSEEYSSPPFNRYEIFVKIMNNHRCSIKSNDV